MSRTRKPLPSAQRDPDQLGKLVSRAEVMRFVELALERERARNDAIYAKRTLVLLRRAAAAVAGIFVILYLYVRGKAAEAQRLLAEYRGGPVGGR